MGHSTSWFCSNQFPICLTILFSTGSGLRQKDLVSEKLTHNKGNNTIKGREFSPPFGQTNLPKWALLNQTVP